MGLVGGGSAYGEVVKKRLQVGNFLDKREVNRTERTKKQSSDGESLDTGDDN